MTKQQRKISKELFQTAYKWGMWGIVADQNSFAWQSQIGELLGNKSNGYHKNKVGVSGACFIENCKRSHLPF